MDMPYLPYFIFHWHLDCFFFWAVVNTAAANIHVQVSLGSFSSVWGGIVGRMVTSFNLLRKGCTVLLTLLYVPNCSVLNSDFFILPSFTKGIFVDQEILCKQFFLFIVEDANPLLSYMHYFLT